MRSNNNNRTRKNSLNRPERANAYKPRSRRTISKSLSSRNSTRSSSSSNNSNNSTYRKNPYKLNAGIQSPPPKGFKSKRERNIWKQDNIFEIKKGDIAEFYSIPLQGFLNLPSRFSGKHHLLLKIVSQNSNKSMSLGFYPIDGKFLSSLSLGWVWTPDPHDLPDKKRVFGNKSYTISKKQANYLNNILKDDGCRLKDGSLSRGIVKRDRLECPTKDFKYLIVPFTRYQHNCVSWLKNLFPELAAHMDEKNISNAGRYWI